MVLDKSALLVDHLLLHLIMGGVRERVQTFVTVRGYILVYKRKLFFSSVKS